MMAIRSRSRSQCRSQSGALQTERSRFTFGKCRNTLASRWPRERSQACSWASSIIGTAISPNDRLRPVLDVLSGEFPQVVDSSCADLGTFLSHELATPVDARALWQRPRRQARLVGAGATATARPAK